MQASVAPVLWVDCREDKCAKALRALNVKFESKALDVGDFWIVCGEQPVCIVERKTWGDLGSSLQDGRYRDQKQRLRRAAAEYRHARVMYLIEGKVAAHSRYHSVAPEALLAAYLGLQVRDGICVLRSVDPTDTARVLRVMLSKHSSRATATWPLRNTSAEASHKERVNQLSDLTAPPPTLSKAGINGTPQTIYLRQLMCVPGVSLGVAKTIAKRCATPRRLRAVLDAEQQTIANLARSRGGRRVGPAVETKLRSAFCA